VSARALAGLIYVRSWPWRAWQIKLLSKQRSSHDLAGLIYQY